MPQDRRRLLGRLGPARNGSRGDRAGRDAGPPREDLEWIGAEVARAEERVAARRARLPKPTYPADLPISQRRDEIARAIAQHQVVVVCGETGSGKTTQLPKICLELGRGVLGAIGHTQPRRIAARSVAARIAEELHVPLGREVGYKVRFGDKTSADTYVKLMTDGILLAETQGDRSLERYDTIIVDEAHERSLNIDFLLGYLRTLLPRRPDLKVIVTSATIDPERFANHFAGPRGPAPIVMVSGRTYPVEVRYRPPAEETADERDEHVQDAIVAAVDELALVGDGDILVFLSGEREIREAAETLHKHHVPGSPQTAILPLYGKLSAEEQSRVFQPHSGRRIVLATNVAETSLTVPGIRYVVDTGFARIGRYSPRTKVQRLEVEAISRASADQRKGRCGRVAPGTCIRLYAEEDFAARPEFTEPEILRTSLASVILQMASLRLGAVERFPFLEPPDSRMIKDGYETLLELGAVDEAGALTDIGRDLARLPIDPRIGRMLLAADREGCLAEALVIASALSVQDPRDRPMEARDRADEAHARWRDEGSDFGTYLNLWKGYRENKRQLSGSRLRRWCKEGFLSFVRMREWEEVHHQLTALMTEMGYRHNDKPAAPDAVLRALLTGLLGNVGVRGEQGEYTAPRSVKFKIFPGSAAFKPGPRWVMAAELVRTTQLYARTVAGIKPEWIEELAAPLLKRSHSDPHWSAETGRVLALERVSLFGLELVKGRKVHYGPIDPVQSREIFIHHALVEGEWDTQAPFFRHNEALKNEIKALEIRSRRQNLLAESGARFAFYDWRVPREVVSAAQFERWLRDAQRHDPRLLYMRPADLVAPGVVAPTKEAFPDALHIGGQELPLEYRLEPATDKDGVTVRIPMEAVAQLPADRFEWLIPGLLPEKIDILLKGMSKAVRKLIPPASQLAAACLPALEFGRGSLIEALRDCLKAQTKIDIPRDAFDGVQLPDYLRLRFEVVGEGGKLLAAGRDWPAIRAALTPRLRSGAIAAPDPRFTKDGIKSWDFGALPERVEIERYGLRVAAYPGLLDRTTSVSLRLFDSPEGAAAASRAGLRRLFILEAAGDLKRVTTGVPGVERMCLQFASLGSPQNFRAGLLELVADRAFLADGRPIRTEREFSARLEAGFNRTGAVLREVVEIAARVLDANQALQVQLDAATPPAWADIVADIREQLGHLLPANFLIATPWDWLRHIPRHLQAAQTRLRKLPGGGLARDLKNMAEVRAMWRGYLDLVQREKELNLDPARIREYRWLVEELRVSVFAQELRTAVPVSTKKLQELWAAIVRG